MPDKPENLSHLKDDHHPKDNHFPKDDKHPLDDRLADYTDRLLRGESLPIETDEELVRLQETVRRLHSARHTIPADPALAERIRVRLAAEWKTNPPMPRSTIDWSPRRRSWIESLSQALKALAGDRRKLSLSLVGMSLVILLLALIFLPSLQGPTTATAFGSSSLLPAVLLIVAAVAVLVYSYLRKK